MVWLPAQMAGSSTSIEAKVYTEYARIAVCVQVVVLDSVRLTVVADSVVVLDNVVLMAVLLDVVEVMFVIVVVNV
jgi:hypothetical protein